MQTRPTYTLLVLAVGVLAISTAAPLIKLVHDVPALVVAAYRLSVAALIMAPFGWTHMQSHHVRIGARDALIVIGAGVCLALHFASWISSLYYTSVASSVVLVHAESIISGSRRLCVCGKSGCPTRSGGALCWR